MTDKQPQQGGTLVPYEALPESKRAPVQRFSGGIPWSLHLEAYDAYCKQYGAQPALIQGGCRGGFGVGELDEFIPGWRERIGVRGYTEEQVRSILAAAHEHYAAQVAAMAQPQGDAAIPVVAYAGHPPSATTTG